MSGSTVRLVPVPSGSPEELSAFCLRCNKGFTRPAQPGRPALYCTPACRTEAYRDLRQARARLAHFEGVVADLRRTVLHLERGDDSAPEQHIRHTHLQDLQRALDRARGTAEALAGSPERSLQPLEALVEAASQVLADLSTE